MFVNPDVPVDSLPAAEQVDWQPLDPRYLRRLLLGRLIRNAIAGLFAVGCHFLVAGLSLPWLTSEMLNGAWGVLGLMALRSFVWPFFSVPRRGYAIRDKDILYKDGVWWRDTMIVPFNRVQHAQTHSAPLDRRFGLARLSAFTAAPGGAVTIPGLSEQTAERLRAYIVSKQRALGKPPLESAG